MPSVDLFTAAEPAADTANGVPVPGPVSDTFDNTVKTEFNGADGAPIADVVDEHGSNSESDDPHGVVEINKRRNGMHRSRNSRTSMALTDYSVNPSSPSDHKRQHIRDMVPEDFLLPNGYPDVSPLYYHHV